MKRSLYRSSASELSKSCIDETLSNRSCLHTLVAARAESPSLSTLDNLFDSLLLFCRGEDKPLSCVFSFTAPELYLLPGSDGGVDRLEPHICDSSCCPTNPLSHSLLFNSSMEGCDFKFCLFGVRNGLSLVRCKAGDEGALYAPRELSHGVASRAVSKNVWSRGGCEEDPFSDVGVCDQRLEPPTPLSLSSMLFSSCLLLLRLLVGLDDGSQVSGLLINNESDTYKKTAFLSSVYMCINSLR